MPSALRSLNAHSARWVRSDFFRMFHSGPAKGSLLLLPSKPDDLTNALRYRSAHSHQLFRAFYPLTDSLHMLCSPNLIRFATAPLALVLVPSGENPLRKLNRMHILCQEQMRKPQKSIEQELISMTSHFWSLLLASGQDLSIIQS